MNRRAGAGVTRRLGANFYEAIRLALTAYKQKGDIDPAVAPREVLMALPDIDEVDVDAQVEVRSDEPEGGRASPAPGRGFRTAL